MSLGLNAQETSYGIKAGFNFSNLTGDLGVGASTRTSIHAGFILENRVSEKFGASFEILYSSLGAKGETERGDGVLKLEYINFPINFKYYLVDNFAIEAGPQIGILASSDLSETGGVNFDLNDNFNSLDFGLNFGTSIKLDSGLMFGLRYYLGLEDIASNENVSGRNRGFFVSTGFFF
jgi:hypothetical protein